MNNSINIPPAKKLFGTITIPGDKSISHRSIILSSLADTPVVIKNFLNSDDCLSTIECMRSLGVKITFGGTGEVTVFGQGLRGLTEPETILNAGNSGTTMRLLAGVLSAMPFFSILTGDLSLSSRPMDRIIAPLSQMGAKILARDGSRFAPLAISGGSLCGIDYHSPVASAQLKSCILLASLVAGCASSITEPLPSRDHTELMLRAFGVNVLREKNKVSITPVTKLTAPEEIAIPGDISSAAFYLAAASIIPGSRILLKNVGVNPTRTGVIKILRRMGADIRLQNEHISGAEEVADIEVSHAKLTGVNIESGIIPSLIDELPVIAAAAMFAEGVTTVEGAAELRVKETDRLSAIFKEFGKLGCDVKETPDGFSIKGGREAKWAKTNSHNDHRMAMALAVAALGGSGADIENFDCVKISYPNFFEEINKLRN
jgi:3-phosphoshikimate 1-carboxyvinyltransferase